MLKRQTSGPKTVHKKRKGNATYSVASLDPIDDNKVVENVRIWDISTSKSTGCMTVSRKTLKHYSQVSLPEEPSTTKKPGGVEEDVHVEDTGILADSESPSEPVEKRPKRKRVRAVKENDSTRMEDWLQSRSVVVDEFLRLDGLGDALNDPELAFQMQ
ncbi:hypothetical protein BDM02DRAFT_3192169 [Thelephora ganbajun]|uniref:Uncharacterized protein n=1 Tax=Thelephora ganbajun TaxID=370292 RepID=A0ACB6Z0N2_THEGA|nr:hypothetical protein BDM02DRAFT_3192169 [Thelephora ganbajun]